MKSVYIGKESLDDKIAYIEQRRTHEQEREQNTAANVSASYAESIVRQVDGSMAIEGMSLTDEDKNRILNFAFDSGNVKSVVADLVKKHSVSR